MPIPENVSRLAAAVATREHFQRTGHKALSKPPKYDGEMLQFMKGARIVGVIFPERWEGKWCLGRHDGAFGAFSAKAIEVRPPHESEIPLGSGSGMSVVAKWKWHPEKLAGASWLEFEKGEVITNLQCE